MSSIFTSTSLFNDSLETQAAKYVESTKKPLTLKSMNCFKYDQKEQQSKVDQISSIDGSQAQKESSNEYAGQSLFSDPFMFGGEEACYQQENLDAAATAQIMSIESNLLNMLDDDESEDSNSAEGAKKCGSDSTSSSALNMSTQDSQGSSPKSQNQMPSFKPQFGFSYVEKVQVAEKKLVHMVDRCTKAKNESEFAFPDGGWECSACCNYNFKGRKRCHRCTKAKNETEKVGKPVHMSLSEQERAVIKATKNQKRIDLKKQTSLAANKSFQDISSSDNEIHVSERPGAWCCGRCQNKNFAFRDSCNKCGLTQFEDNQMKKTQSPQQPIQLNYSENNYQQQPQYNVQQQIVYYPNQMSQQQAMQQVIYQPQVQQCQYPQQYMYNNMYNNGMMQQQQQYINWQ